MTTLQLTIPINNMKTQILEGMALLKDFHAVVRSPQSNILLVIAIQNPQVVFGYIFFSFNADQKSLESQKKSFKDISSLKRIVCSFLGINDPSLSLQSSGNYYIEKTICREYRVVENERSCHDEKK